MIAHHEIEGQQDKGAVTVVTHDGGTQHRKLRMKNDDKRRPGRDVARAGCGAKPPHQSDEQDHRRTIEQRTDKLGGHLP